MEGEKERMEAGSLGRSGLQSYLCLWQPVTMAGGFICSSCHFLSCHTAGQSWQCWAEGLWWHKVQTCTERGVTVPAPSSSQSNTYSGTCTRRRHVYDYSLGHLVTESSPRPWVHGCHSICSQPCHKASLAHGGIFTLQYIFLLFKDPFYRLKNKSDPWIRVTFWMPCLVFTIEPNSILIILTVD